MRPFDPSPVAGQDYWLLDEYAATDRGDEPWPKVIRNTIGCFAAACLFVCALVGVAVACGQ